MNNSPSELDEKPEDIPELSDQQSAVNRVHAYRDELNIIFHRSQESFEKQLSFISAGALTLSVGFIHDIVKDFEHSSCKKLLGWGWVMLVATLLVNLISHLIASRIANKAIKEINENTYDPNQIERRNRIVVKINWASVFIMICGITLIIFFITLYRQP